MSSRTLCCSDRDDVWEFLDRWWENKAEAAEFGTSWMMRGEWNSRYLKNCSSYASDGRESISTAS